MRQSSTATTTKYVGVDVTGSLELVEVSKVGPKMIATLLLLLLLSHLLLPDLNVCASLWLRPRLGRPRGGQLYDRTHSPPPLPDELQELCFLIPISRLTTMWREQDCLSTSARRIG
ncbi:hypothetical protein BO82DRAFT_49886 [Aspergillus uvarum CBS 121591]|uniref:Uncharacterized protein n=1 Tax=Aspergillus uvarum CBS 121591 TaxID=1448315 RepID=A0A319CIF4_9EURO|nr:hypothetical protein BO82DRAFT_49886 [Aspergillus uvarum CBS 121591]PYH83027.1 hypothetical protein BO82DRAFT_49886 [Aspergillus uvarum CBS 121591]